MATLADAPLEYDPFSKEVMENPLRFYKALREQAPALYLPKYDTWVFSRFQDIIDVLTIGDNTFIATDTTLPTPEILLRHNNGQVSELPLEPHLPIGALLGSPHFEVLRNAHIKPFRPTYVRSMAGFIAQRAEARLDALLSGGRFDLTQEYGGIVAAEVICHLLDMPLSRAPEVLQLVNQCSQTDPKKGGTDISVTISRCVGIMAEYIRKRRTAGADGSVPLIDGLLQLQYYGRTLSDEEIATQLTCVFIGGVETAPKILAHGIMELSARPEQCAEVRRNLDANVPTAVEEMIRYCAPAQWFARTAHKDVNVAAANIKKGQRIIVLFGSAARDPAEFTLPDEFIWNRKIPRVLSFGTGQHYCIGIHLARLEIRILAKIFLQRVPLFSFDMKNAVRHPSSFQWGWNVLPIAIS